MNAKEAKEIISKIVSKIKKDPGIKAYSRGEAIVIACATGYLAALEGPEVSALVKALEAIKNREQYSCDCVGGDDGECSCDFSFTQFVAEQALKEFKGEQK